MPTRGDAPSSPGVCRHHIILVHLVHGGFGGLETHVLNLARHLAARGQPPLLVLAKGSQLHRLAEREGLPCHALGWMRWLRGQPLRELLLYLTLLALARRVGARVIHCNNRFEVAAVRRAARQLHARSVFNYHVPDPFETSVITGVDTVIAPNAPVLAFIRAENAQRGLGIRRIELLPPVFDAKKFLDFVGGSPARDWFFSELQLPLKKGPIVCMIGNMVEDLEHKNYPLLFHAFAYLIHERKIEVQAVLVGDGPSRGYLEKLARTLRVHEHVHFVGQRQAQVPGIIGHSDMLVLASSHEAFGIVLVEAALMKKPAIAARRTGAEQVIIDGKTGLLFDNGSEISLAHAIEALIRRPEWRQLLGGAAYERACEHFVPEVVVGRYIDIYATT